MTVPLALDANLILSGEVTNITIGADNPQGVITLFGELFIDTDIAPRTFEGAIGLTGSLATEKIGVGCFDTIYDQCVEGNPTGDADCIGSCAESPPPEEPECPECPECPEPEPCEPCPDCPDCPPVVVSNCNDVLRILSTKVLAWHIVTCGVQGATQEDGIVVTDGLEYEDQAEAEANGWVFEDQLGDSNWQVGATDFVYEGTRCFKAVMNGDGSLAGSSWLRASKIFGPGHGLVADEAYTVTARMRLNAKSGFDVHKKIVVEGTIINDDAASSAAIGAFELLNGSVTSTPGAIVIVRFQLQHSFVRQVRQIWMDDVIISGPASGVHQWDDLGPLGNHLTADSGSRPQLIGTLLDGHNTMVFNGAWMEWPTTLLNGITSLEAFIVVKSNAGSGLWRLGSDSADPTLFPETGTLKVLDNIASASRLDYGAQVVDLTTGFRIYHVHALQSELTATIDNVLQFGPQGYTQAFSAAPEIGRSAVGTPGNFEVAEILLTTELNELERFNTMSILAQRWGLTI